MAVFVDFLQEIKKSRTFPLLQWLVSMTPFSRSVEHPDDAARFSNANAVLEFLKTSGGLISAEKLEEVGENSFIALVDGGLSDNTGVANAVYQGRVSIKVLGEGFHSRKLVKFALGCPMMKFWQL